MQSNSFILAAALAMALTALPISAQTNATSAAISTNAAAVATTNDVPAYAGNTATNPVPRDPKWVKRHEGFLEIAKAGGIDILFLGDSITDGWRTRGSNVWNKCYATRHAANFGIGGDRTEHVLWRIQEGELDGIHPKVLILMIGTNNTGKEKDGHARNTTHEVIEGVQHVVNAIRAKLPDTRILLLGVFPRAQLDDLQRAQVSEVNPVISKLDDGRMIRYLDIGGNFLEADGTLPKSIMPDALHPNERGYQIWADAMEETLAAMLK
jgi:lysophospholipase L1-like esterase